MLPADRFCLNTALFVVVIFPCSCSIRCSCFCGHSCSCSFFLSFVGVVVVVVVAVPAVLFCYLALEVHVGGIACFLLRQKCCFPLLADARRVSVWFRFFLRRRLLPPPPPPSPPPPPTLLHTSATLDNNDNTQAEVSTDADVLAAVNVASYPDGQAVNLEAVFGTSITFDDAGDVTAARATTQVGVLPRFSCFSWLLVWFDFIGACVEFLFGLRDCGVAAPCCCRAVAFFFPRHVFGYYREDHHSSWDPRYARRPNMHSPLFFF